MASKSPKEHFGWASWQLSPLDPSCSAMLKAEGSFSSNDDEGLKNVHKTGLISSKLITKVGNN
jgi:hypothetical protein